MIGANLTSCHVKLILVTPLGSKTRKLGAFGSYIPTYCSKTWLERYVFQSQNLHLWNIECVKSVALEGGLSFRCSLAWDEVLQLACCCFELKVTGFHLVLLSRWVSRPLFPQPLSEVENGVKPCRIYKTFWSIQTQLICCIEDFKVCCARSFRDGSVELLLPAWILIPNNGKRLSSKGTRKNICPARNELAFTVLRLYGLTSTDFSGFCVKRFQHGWQFCWLHEFQVRLGFFSPSSALKSDVNGWFIL